MESYRNQVINISSMEYWYTESDPIVVNVRNGVRFRRSPHEGRLFPPGNEAIKLIFLITFTLIADEHLLRQTTNQPKRTSTTARPKFVPPSGELEPIDGRYFLK